MKYIKLLFLIAAFCIISTVSAFAADTTISLQSVVLQNNNIIIKGKIENAVENQQITIMATDVYNDSYNKDGIFYIDQQDAELDESGAFTVSSNISKVLSNESVYIVRVGGTNINTPAQMIITTGDETKILLGDVNLDGLITADDAAITLQEVLYNLDYLTEKQLAAMKVTKSDVITSDNAANILVKALNSMYIFPVEQ